MELLYKRCNPEDLYNLLSLIRSPLRSFPKPFLLAAALETPRPIGYAYPLVTLHDFRFAFELQLKEISLNPLATDSKDGAGR